MAITFKDRLGVFSSMKAFLQSISSTLTDFNDGSVLSNIFDTISEEIGSYVYVNLQDLYDNLFIATASGAGLDARVADFTLVRKQASSAEGQVIFSRATPYNQDFLIPIGTVVQTQSTDTVQGVQFQTIEDKTLAANELSVIINVEAIQSGIAGNINSNSISVILNPPAGIETVTNTEIFTGGTDIETDDELRARVPLFLQSLARGTITAIEAVSLSVTGVKNITIIEPDPPTGVFNVLVDDGTGSATSTLIREVKNAINGLGTYETAYRPIATQANVLAPIKFSVNIVMAIEVETNYTFSIVQTNIMDALEAYLATLSAAQKVKRAEIIRVAKEVAGVANIDTVNMSINGNTTIDLVIATNYVARSGLLTISEI